MAEPNNTPMPGATPIPGSTPRSGSPTPPLPSFLTTTTIPPPSAEAATTTPGPKPIVLHIGDAIQYNPATYSDFSTLFNVIRPPVEERQRPAFMQALREKRWGGFQAIFRPFWGTGGEMGTWDRELIELLPETVKVFASAGAGFDWADTKVLGEKGIIYCNSGLAASAAVADFSLAMIISTFRHLPWCTTAASSGSPSSFQSCHRDATAQSRNLAGQNLGIVGFGNIGQAIAQRCAWGFDMRVNYYDIIRKDRATEEKLRATYYGDLDSLLKDSDCVVLCTPAGPGGALMTTETFSKMKDGARFVNIARGSLVDDGAVADALESGKLSAVAFDVHSAEPEVNPRLLKMSGGKAMLTCHNAGGTVDTHAGFEELSMRNIMSVLMGGQAITPVNLGHLRVDG